MYSEDKSVINVLMIEDNSGDARITKEILAEVDKPILQLYWKKNLKEGLGFCSENNIDIILLDLSLPDSQGIESLITLHQIVPTIPVILLTGLDDETLGIKALQEGAQDYLIKGNFDPDTLIRSIRYSIERKKVEQRLIEAQKKAEQANKELLASAHKAGMADVASTVLHNVGNVLSSVIVSNDEISQLVKQLEKTKFFKANELLRKNLDNLEDFIINDPKGKKLIQYYLSLDSFFNEFINRAKKESSRLTNKIEMIKDIIISQQNYAIGSNRFDEVDLSSIILDSFKIVESSLAKQHIEVDERFSPIPKLKLQKTKLFQLFINILKNAKEAMDKNDPQTEKKITISTQSTDTEVECIISDTGIGVKPEHLKKLFKFGFTTKESGHGLGLHSCANYMKELNGSITIESDGPGKGASTILRFPLNS